MRKLIIWVAASLAIGGAADGLATAAAATSHASRGNVVAVFAKTCPSGFTHGVIGGEQKCLHAGEYCAHSRARQYRRYHFKCVRVRGTYRLEHS
jgi:hypothetical protein